jgi:hypothetical protein
MKKLKVTKLQGSYKTLIEEGTGLDVKDLYEKGAAAVILDNKSTNRNLTFNPTPRKRLDSNTLIFNVFDYERFRMGLPELCYNIVISDLNEEKQ